MFEATGYTPENDAVDWRELADQIFPAEALEMQPVFDPLAVLKKAGRPR
jgi:hypothetical protein